MNYKTRISHRSFAPSTKLKDFIAEYRVYDIKKDKVLTPIIMLPEGIIEVVFQRNVRIDTRSHSKNEYCARSSSIIGGLHTQAYYFLPKNEGLLFSIRFKVGAFSFFTNSSVHFLKNKLEAVVDYWPLEGTSLHEGINSTSCVQEMISLTNSFFTKKLKLNYQLPFYIKLQEVDDIICEKSIEECATFFHYSTSRFRYIFKKIVGVSPAEYKKILRFNLAYELKDQYDNLSQLSDQLGYFDLSHFNRETNVYSGLNPSTLFRALESTI